MQELDALASQALDGTFVVEDADGGGGEDLVLPEPVASARALRAYIKSLRAAGNVSRRSHAQLVFAPEPTEEKLQKLDFLERLQPTGMVPIKVFERAAQDVYGLDIHFKEPPVPLQPPAAPKAKPPAPDRKRKRSDTQGQGDGGERKRDKNM